MPLQHGETRSLEAIRADAAGDADESEKATVEVTLERADVIKIVPIVRRFRKEKKSMKELSPERGPAIMVPRTALRTLLTRGGSRRFLSQTDPAYAVSITAYGETATLDFPTTTWGGLYFVKTEELTELVEY